MKAVLYTLLYTDDEGTTVSFAVRRCKVINVEYTALCHHSNAYTTAPLQGNKN